MEGLLYQGGFNWNLQVAILGDTFDSHQMIPLASNCDLVRLSR